MKKIGILLGVLLLIVALTALPATAVLADGTITIGAKALDDHECDATEWHFVINQVDGEANAPATIHVVWANGASEDVAMWKFTGGVAHYATTSNLDSSVISAIAVIYDTWDGQFNLSHGPCTPPPPPPMCEWNSQIPASDPLCVQPPPPPPGTCVHLSDWTLVRDTGWIPQPDGSQLRVLDYVRYDLDNPGATCGPMRQDPQTQGTPPPVTGGEGPSLWAMIVDWLQSLFK